MNGNARVFSLRIPKTLAERLDLRKSDKMSFHLEGSKLILEPVRDAVELAVKGKKFASISFEDVEKISMEEQDTTMNNSSHRLFHIPSLFRFIPFFRPI